MKRFGERAEPHMAGKQTWGKPLKNVKLFRTKGGRGRSEKAHCDQIPGNSTHLRPSVDRKGEKVTVSHWVSIIMI